MNRLEIRPLVRAVNRWLSFQQLCGRERLFSEAYLAQSVGEFLMSNYVGSFHREVNHPTLNSLRPGRPNQIDYALRSPQSDALVTTIECKWIRDRRVDKQLIIDDLLRLECVRFSGRYVTRYFLVAGELDSFEERFRYAETNQGLKFTQHFLEFKDKGQKRSVSVIQSPAELRKYYKRFEAAYSTKVPKTFTTTLSSWTRVGRIAVYLWEIGSVGNSSRFKPSEAWAD